MKVKTQQDSVFIIGGMEEIGEIKNGLETGYSNKFVYTVDEELFDKVKKFTELFQPTINIWLNRHDKPGTTYYWEENYHDKICAMLHTMMPEVLYRDISNCLCALDM